MLHKRCPDRLFLTAEQHTTRAGKSHRQQEPTMASRPRASSQPGKLSFFNSSKAPSAGRLRAASSYTGTLLEEELTCTVCYEIFKDPVVLKCSHSFCQSCLQQFWNKKKAKRECPICRRTCSLTEPTVSLALKNVSDTFLREQVHKTATAGAGAGEQAKTVEVKCSAHGEALKLFCLDDFEVLCCVCHTSKKHQGHQLCPLEEGAQDLKVMCSCLSACGFSYSSLKHSVPQSPKDMYKLCTHFLCSHPSGTAPERAGSSKEKPASPLRGQAGVWWHNCAHQGINKHWDPWNTRGLAGRSCNRWPCTVGV